MISVVELAIKPKGEYGHGDEHTIYKSLKDPDKVFKMSGGEYKESDLKWIEVFKKHPDIFPKVYRVFKKGAEVEKLDTVKASKEYMELKKAIGSNFFSILHWLPGKSDSAEIMSYIQKDLDNLKQNHPELVKPFMKWISLVIKVSKAINSNNVDIHQGQFGYDKQGNLKMLDI